MKKSILTCLVVCLLFFSAKIVWGYTEGAVNNFFGDAAGFSNTTIGTGTGNSFFGVSAGYSNTEGNNNSFFGAYAGNQNTTGIFNSFIGYEAGSLNTTGEQNNFLGVYAGYSNTSGNYNNFIGTSAGYNNTTGHNNSFIGSSAGFNNTTGRYNNFFGDNTGYSNTTGHDNIFIGAYAGYLNTSGYDNIFIGAYAGYSNNTSSYNSFSGYAAGYHNVGYFNSFTGFEAGRFNTAGGDNSFFGAQTGYSNTTGSSNSFFGRNAGLNNTGGFNNTFLGTYAGYWNTTGSRNVFLGWAAGYNETGSNKLYISNSEIDPPLIYGEFDNQYLEVNGSLNVQGTDASNSFQLKVMGHGGGNSHTQMATDLADSRLTFMASTANDQAPRLILVGPQDVSAGLRGLAQIDTGSLYSDLPDAKFIVRHLDTTGGKVMIRVLGRNGVSFPTGNVGIGTTTPTHLIELAGGAYSDGTTWVNASSRELKENIKEVSAEEAFKTVENLKPVAFNYKGGNQELHVGFIAEDVPEIVATGDRKGLEAMDIVAVLTKVVQEQQRSIGELQEEIGQLKTALQFKQDKDANLAQAN